jgi:protein-S-isoprenylcysteine O-methyltransferase Ste14
VASASFPVSARLGLVLLASLVFIVLGLAEAHFFRRPVRDQRLRFRLHQALSLFVGVVHLAAASVAPLAVGASFAVAIGLLIGGIGLFLWAQETVKRAPPYLAFSDVAPEHLFVTGPYRLVRHPFYVSFMAVLFAVPVATANPWLLVWSLVMAANYVTAACEEEAAFARTPYAERHRAYTHRAGMFMPRARALVPTAFEGPLSSVAIGAIVVALGLSVALLWELLRS